MEKMSAANFEKTLTANSLVAAIFVSDTVEQCKQITDLVVDLVKQDKYSSIKFVSLGISSPEEASMAKGFAVNSVPTTVLFRNANEIERIVGADTQQFVSKVDKLVDSYNTLEQRLKALINQQPVMVFIKGSPSQPRCGFSRTLVAILNELGVTYGHFDILTDEDVRQGLKNYSKWPTYPQVYVNGNLIGGLDIVKEMHESGDLADALKV